MNCTHSTPLQLRRFTRPAVDQFANANRSWKAREGLHIRVDDAPITSGLGEASPLPGYSSETRDECEQWLGQLNPKALNRLLELRNVHMVLERVQQLPGHAPAAARFGLETALLDRLGRILTVPLWQLLQKVLPVCNRQAPSQGLALAAIVSGRSVPEAVGLAEGLFERGVRTFKVKIGPVKISVLQHDTLEALRNRWGDAVALRCDANQSLHPDCWPELSKLAEQLTLELIEEPWPQILKPWPSKRPCALGVDESLQPLADAPRLQALRSPECDVVVVKPTALGGFLRCLTLAREAQETGRAVVVSHTLEGPIGWLACAHLAVALNSPTSAGLWPMRHQLPIPASAIRNGRLLPLATEGLGRIALD